MAAYSVPMATFPLCQFNRNLPSIVFNVAFTSEQAWSSWWWWWSTLSLLDHLFDHRVDH